MIKLSDLITDCKDLIQPLALERNIHFYLESTEDVSVFIDQTRLKQVLLNLLSNAVKYNSDNGFIKLKVQTNAGETLQISVEDSGAGIPSHQIPNLFQAFNRLDAEKGEIEGTGIGLVITKKTVEAMGGTISYKGEYGQGSTFFVDIPLAMSTNSLLKSRQVSQI